MKFILSFLLLAAFAANAQQSMEKGDIYYDFFQYREAIREYESALKNERTFKNEAHLLTQLAYSYLYTFQYEKAEQHFAALVKLGDKKQLPDVYLDYGNVLKILGKYEKAREQYAYYSTLMGRGDPYTEMLNRSLAWAEKHKDSVRTRTQVSLTNLDIAGQSLGYGYFMDGLIYARAKDSAYKEYTVLYDLAYAGIKDSVTFVKAEDDYVDEIRFPFNEGSPSVSADGETIYFTATATKVKKGVVRRVGTTEISEDGVSNLKIYFARFNNGKFGYVQELPFGNKQYNCTHPCISRDGNTLYFASDMPGGFGGYDIYKVARQPDGTWGKPVNLGDRINTTEHDIYPYADEQYLYFVSKGHVGFGGYDIFQSPVGMNALPGQPRNMGKPFNSSKDDVAFIIARDGITGYFSSNRDNANGFDKVYYFNDDARPRKPAPVPVTAATPKPQRPEQPVPATAATTLEAGKTLSTVFFAFNRNTFDQAFFLSLDSALNAARNNKNIRLNIHAHTDCRGSDAYNLALSKRRAQSVKNYLVSKGIAASRIGMISYGESEPVVSCDPCGTCAEEQHRVNRRVEVKVAAASR